MDKRKKKEEYPSKFSRTFYVIIGILFIVSVMTVVSFTNPEILIGWYLDQDIRNQLIQLNEKKLLEMPDEPKNPEDVMVNVRFTFDNDDLKDIRVSRSIDIFNELFDGIERDYSIKELEEETQLVFRWSLLDQR